MEHHALTLSVVILVINYTTSSDIQTPDASLQEHVKKLDEMLAELQSHSQAQEQKYSAVLSSLLSQLTQTTDELGDLKTSHNETVRRLEDLKTDYNETLLISNKRDAEFSELWASHNETTRKLEEKNAELSELWTSQNETVRRLEDKDVDLSKLLENHNATIRKLEQKDAQFSELSETVVKLESTLMKCKENDAELPKLWASHNETVLKLESTNLKLKEKDEELSKLWARQNATVIELIASNHSVERDLAKTKHDLKVFEGRLDSNGYIGFQGRLSENKNVTADSPLPFDGILYNAGGGYDNNTGRFTIPMNGTYHIWVALSYTRPKESFVFRIYRNGHILDHAYGSRSDPHETSTTTAMTYLHKGEDIWIAPSVNVSMDRYFCNFGIVLLNAH